MNNTLLHLYHKLPGHLRSAAATARGFYLHSWRYGPETEHLVEEAFERESWSSSRWTSWQQERLAYVLNRAATRVPYYREHWSARRRSGDRRDWSELQNWSILEKEEVRRNAKAFVADDCNIKSMFHEHTSGTSGKPLDLWWSRDTVRRWYALMESRCRRWHGVSRLNRWAILGGQLVAPARQRRPPFWVWNLALNQLYMSSYHLSPDLIRYYVKALERYRIEYVFGYTSALYALAQGILKLGIRNLQMIVAVTNAEPIFDYQREAISQAFRCPVRETYGMAEIVTTASECPAGQLHLWPEVGYVEFVENSEPAKHGPGDLVCTGLFNPDMPLIRYRVGDRATPLSDDTVCSCARTLPRLAAIDGRIDDVLYTADGRAVGRLDPVFKAELPIREAQVIQESLDRIRVRYVPEAEFTTADGRSIVDRLQARMGPIKVILEPVSQVPRDSSGKFRAVINNISSSKMDCAHRET